MIAIVPAILFSFQNCAPKSFVAGADDTGRPVDPQECAPPSDCPVDPTKPFDLVAHTIRTEMNQPKDWSAPFNGEKDPYHLSLANNADTNKVDIADKGTIEILDPKTFSLRFVPDFGFRGSLLVWLYALDDKGALKSSVQVKIDVGNSLNHFQPALAVRGSGCVMCHANVQSNIVTDMGYGSDYFFSKNISNPLYFWNQGSPYGDFEAFYKNRTGNWANLSLPNDRVVFVPKNAALPVQAAKDATGASTLKQYIEHRFANSVNGSAVNADVAEKSKVYIGAPTADRIRSAFGVNNTTPYKYDRDPGSGAFDLSGLKDMGNYWTNDGTLQCDGDLMVNGTLLLKNLNLRTHTGCRIYATRSVYIYGPIIYESIPNSDLRNLQITSARSIQMGLGKMHNASNQHCEEGKPQGQRWYYIRRQTFNADTANYSAEQKAIYDKALGDSAFNRLAGFFTNLYSNTRDGRPVTTVNNELYDEYISTIGPQYDASCSNRAISYSRLLLNAPRVDSRYNGNFIGSVVAEISVMALGQFKFEFDPVFREVSILPKLTDDDYLKIE